METKWRAVVIVALVLTGSLATGVLLLREKGIVIGKGVRGLSGVDLRKYLEQEQSEVTYMRICGNSSDIVYAELMEATFTPLESGGGWGVEALFLNDSEGPYEIDQYTENFIVNIAEVNAINSALFHGLEQTFPSDGDIITLNYQMGFQLEIFYDDDSWISILTLQSFEGHIVLLGGSGPPDCNLLNGDLLQPGTALDGLISAISTVFSAHLG